MPKSGMRFSIPFPFGLVLGIALMWFGLRALYHQFQAKSASPIARATAALLCKITAPASPTLGPDNHPLPEEQRPALVTSLSGATLKLTGPPKAALDETVVVNLCVEAKPDLPEARRQALKNHLLVQLSAVGLQIQPHGQINPAASSESCLGTASWTVRANAPGRYTAVLIPESTDQQPNRAPAAPSKPLWDFDLEQPALLNIQFQPEWTDYLQKSWGALSTVLGTVLVFTQIMLNLRQRKKSQAR